MLKTFNIFLFIYLKTNAASPQFEAGHSEETTPPQASPALQFTRENEVKYLI